MKEIEKNIKLILNECCPDPCPGFNPVSDLESLFKEGQPFTDRIVARCGNEKGCPLLAYIRQKEEIKDVNM